jgi:hypothetical protein
VSDADRVAIGWTATGTHFGPAIDLEPTRRTLDGPGLDMVRLEDGRLVELWAYADAAAQWDQLTC